jgi:hypothetical protein
MHLFIVPSFVKGNTYSTIENKKLAIHSYIELIVLLVKTILSHCWIMAV